MSSAGPSRPLSDPPVACLAEEWHRDGRGLWARRVCRNWGKHPRHDFASWEYNVQPPTVQPSDPPAPAAVPVSPDDELERIAAAFWRSPRSTEDLWISIRAAALASLGAASPASPWQPISTAPRNATWIIGKFRDEDVRRIHFAEDLSGSDQPAFSGWFYESGKSFHPCEPIAWMPDPPAASVGDPQK